ncbi:MAG TPA: hypothetical protein VFA19_07550 [Gaiellaceae bacterium]|nr:hypothetical protein [Gaiellaceae bacterium]
MSTARAAWYTPVVVEPKRSQWRLFWPLLIPVVVLVGFAAYVYLTPQKPHPLVPPPGRVGALVWGDGIFASTPEMQAWLRLHGGRYPAWATRHPRGVSLISKRDKAHRHVAASARKRAAR